MSQKKSKCSCKYHPVEDETGIVGLERSESGDCPECGTKAPKDCPDCGQPENMHDAECKSNGVLAFLKSKQPSKAPLREQEVERVLTAFSRNWVNTTLSDVQPIGFEEAKQRLQSHADSQVGEALERVRKTLSKMGVVEETSPFTVWNEVCESVDEELKKLEEK